jgi:hypothetical protein
VTSLSRASVESCYARCSPTGCSARAPAGRSKERGAHRRP